MRRKRTNGCLLSILKHIVVGSFILLMSFFGMYILTTPTKILQSTEQVMNEIEKPSVLQGGDDIKTQSIEKGVPQSSEEGTIDKRQRIEVLPKEVMGLKETEAVTTPDSQPLEEIIIQIPIENINIENEELVPTQKEEIEVEEKRDSEKLVDIPVYDRYALNLDKEILKEAENLLKDGQINVTNVIGQYFANMSMQEKLRLVNMLVSKMKNVDVGYVWGVVADGITLEETVVLQKLIEEHFTEDEIDELYGYYKKSELAQVP